jgi:hypothetical protein
MMGRGRVSAPTRLTLKNAEKEIRPKHEYADPADDRHTLTNADTPHPESLASGFCSAYVIGTSLLVRTFCGINFAERPWFHADPQDSKHE